MTISIKTAATFLALIATPLAAQTPAGYNLSGVSGVIDMPSGEMQPDGTLSISHGQLGPIGRNTLSFQILPRLSGSFRYVGIQKWDDVVPDAFDVYYDRNFDLSYQVLRESRYLPSVTIGLQDFIGTSLSMAEYVAATKNFGPLKVTAGLGFGRLGSHGSIGSPFGERPPVDFGLGGKPNLDQWFRGPMAPFAGLEYQVTDKLRLKAEYSSDLYLIESQRKRTFDYRSPINFGFDYQISRDMRLGAYSMYGSEIGLSLTVSLNPDQRPTGGMGGPGPIAVLPRATKGQPLDWTEVFATQPQAQKRLMDNMNASLERTGLTVEALSVEGDRAQVRYRNISYEAPAQAAGRVARAMTWVMPPSVEVFELVPLANGMATPTVVVRRSDIESLEFAPDSGTKMRARTKITLPAAPLDYAWVNPDLYPRFTWSLAPDVRTMLFDPNAPFQAILGAKLAANYEVSPGVILSGSVVKSVVGSFRAPKRPTLNGPVPPVRTNSAVYSEQADPGIETLTAAWYGKLAPEVYGRVTVGYLEQMFGGISAEALWKPDNRRWALGVEANYVSQRDVDGGLGFGQFDYQVATGAITGYYDFGRGFEAKVDVGRYLAGDVGATFTLMRTFENGWKVGAFGTLTNLSAKQYGEGSFDKGILIEIPVSWFVGSPSRTVRPILLRPLLRDGGAQLKVNDRLAETLRNYDTAGYDAQWGRFWK